MKFQIYIQMNNLKKITELSKTIPVLTEVLEIYQDIKATETEIDIIFVKQRVLEKELQNKLTVLLLDKENSPLLGGVWDLELNKDNEFYLSYYGDKSFILLSHLFEDDYHCSSVIINDKFIIYYNDGEVTLQSYLDGDLFKDLIEPLNLKYKNKVLDKLTSINTKIDELTNIKLNIEKLIENIKPLNEI